MISNGYFVMLQDSSKYTLIISLAFFSSETLKMVSLIRFDSFFFILRTCTVPYRIKCNIKNVVTLKSSEEIFMRGDKAGSNDF